MLQHAHWSGGSAPLERFVLWAGLPNCSLTRPQGMCLSSAMIEYVKIGGTDELCDKEDWLWALSLRLTQGTKAKPPLLTA